MSFLTALFVQAAGFGGEWSFAIDSPEGIIKVPVILSVEKNDWVVAKIVGVEIKGALRDGNPELAGELYAEQAGYQAPVKATGKVDGHEIRSNASHRPIRDQLHRHEVELANFHWRRGVL